MSKVFLSDDDAFRDFISCRMRKRKITQTDMAKALKMKSRQVFAYHLQTLEFTYSEFRTMFRLLEVKGKDLERWFL